jgi:hypothetical protein
MRKSLLLLTLFSLLMITTGAWAQDEKAKVSSGDSTPGFLMNKFQAGPDIELTESGTSDRIIIIGRKPVLTTEGDLLTHDGNKEVRFGVGANGEVLTADSASPNGIKWGTVPAGADGADGVDGESGKDDADGVEITFTREYEYDPGTGAVPAIDINGTALVISQTDPTVTLGGQARTVLATSDIPNTTPQLQQVVIDMPASLLAGNYKLKLTNTQGDSETVIPLNEIALHDGSTWTQATANGGFPGRNYGEVLSYSGKLWIIGGETPSTKNDVWSSTDGITWTQATANAGWSARAGHSSIVFDNKMWVMGGGTSGGFVNDVWSSTDGITWTQATASASWPVRGYFEAVVLNNKMWVLGGLSTGSVFKNDVWSSSDGVTWTQESANAGFTGRYGLSAIAYDNKLWVLAGYDGGYKNDVWSSPDGITWTQATASAAWSGRGFSASVVYDNKMWLLAGHSSGGSEVWSSTDGSSWTQATSNTGWGNRSGAGAAVLNGRIWLASGYLSGGGYAIDVWHTSD